MTGMATIHLIVVTPERKFFEDDAEKVIVRTTGGDVCILPNHIDYAAALGSGEARITETDGNVKKAHAEGGMIHVASNQVQVIADRFEWKE